MSILSAAEFNDLLDDLVSQQKARTVSSASTEVSPGDKVDVLMPDAVANQSKLNYTAVPVDFSAGYAPVTGAMVKREFFDRIGQIRDDFRDNIGCNGCIDACLSACKAACSSCSSGCTGGARGKPYLCPCYNGGCRVSAGGVLMFGCGGCHDSCSDGCYGSCQGSCANGCSSACQNGCKQTCRTGCSRSCSSGCSNSARFGALALS